MKNEIWKSIIKKYENSHGHSEFLDSLTSDEFSEYMSERPVELLK